MSLPPPVRLTLLHHLVDESFLLRLMAHLGPLLHSGIIVVWHSGIEPAGFRFLDVLAAKVAEADILLVLLSADFLLFWNSSLARILGPVIKTRQRILPILVGPCDLTDSAFAGFQGLPRNGVPLRTLSAGAEEALAGVADGIRQAVAEFRSPRMGRPITLRLDVPEYTQPTLEREIAELRDELEWLRFELYKHRRRSSVLLGGEIGEHFPRADSRSHLGSSDLNGFEPCDSEVRRLEHHLLQSPRDNDALRALAGLYLTTNHRGPSIKFLREIAYRRVPVSLQEAAEAFALAAKVCLQQDMLDLMIDYYFVAHILDSESETIMLQYAIGLAHFISAGRAESTNSFLQRADTLLRMLTNRSMLDLNDPDKARAWLLRARVALRLGAQADAQLALTRSLQIFALPEALATWDYLTKPEITSTPPSTPAAEQVVA